MNLPKNEIRALIASLAGLPEKLVLWSGEPVPFVGPRTGTLQGPLTLNLVSAVSVGVDDMRRSVEGSTLASEQRAYRLLTISLRLESYGPEEASDVLERVRVRIRRPSSLAALRAADCALVDATNVTSYDASADNRELSAAQLDLRIAQTLSDTATETGDTWIETVEDPAGTFS